MPILRMHCTQPAGWFKYSCCSESLPLEAKRAVANRTASLKHEPLVSWDMDSEILEAFWSRTGVAFPCDLPQGLQLPFLASTRSDLLGWYPAGLQSWQLRIAWRGYTSELGDRGVHKACRPMKYGQDGESGALCAPRGSWDAEMKKSPDVESRRPSQSQRRIIPNRGTLAPCRHRSTCQAPIISGMQGGLHWLIYQAIKLTAESSCLTMPGLGK